MLHTLTFLFLVLGVRRNIQYEGELTNRIQVLILDTVEMFQTMCLICWGDA